MNFREFSSQNPIYIGLMSYLNKHFSNYETFFNSCLIQLIDGHWRDNMHPIFEQIGMTDYGIIKSLNYIRISICDITVGDPNQTFKNIYFHFGLIFFILLIFLFLSVEI